MKGELEEYCILKAPLPAFLVLLLRDFMDDTKNAMIGKYLRGHHVSGLLLYILTGAMTSIFVFHFSYIGT